jgi:hypothetical protein
VQSVLGLSMTSTSVGWVLLDGQGPDAAVLDNDAFDIQSAAGGAGGDASPHAAAARGAQTIATASGHKVDAVHVTWTDDVEADATALLESLADLGFDNVHSISLSRAAMAWGTEVGKKSEHAKTGLCILEPHMATVMIIATAAGTVRTAVTETRESAEDLVEWLRTIFRTDGWLPESLYLVGAHSDLDEVTQPIAAALPIAVSDSVDTQIALARGAALTTVNQGEIGTPQTAELPRRVSVAKKPADPVTATVTDAPATEMLAKPRIEPQRGSSKRQPSWPVAHAKKLTMGVAAIAVFGAALSLAAGSALNVENSSAQAIDPAPVGALVTSISIHTPPPQPVPQLQPLAAEPPPGPPLEPPPPPAEPVASVAPEPVAIPAPEPTVTAVPHAVPAPTTVAPPTVAPLAAPPPAAVPAPVAPPPPEPAPPAPAEGAEPPPSDPIQQVLSPLFSALP